MSRQGFLQNLFRTTLQCQKLTSWQTVVNNRVCFLQIPCCKDYMALVLTRFLNHGWSWNRPSTYKLLSLYSSSSRTDLTLSNNIWPLGQFQMNISSVSDVTIFHYYYYKLTITLTQAQVGRRLIFCQPVRCWLSYDSNALL